MGQAREALAGKWHLAVGTFFLYMIALISIQSIPKAGFLISLLISGPMGLGAAIFSLSLSRNNNPHLEQIFEGFKRFGVALRAYLLVTLYTLLWALLLIVPGIIAGLGYSMTFYILADDDSIGAQDAMKKSKKMMDGSKWRLFFLGLRFFGWSLLAILTLGIGFLWLIPYMQVSLAKFYDDLKKGDAEGGSNVNLGHSI